MCTPGVYGRRDLYPFILSTYLRVCNMSSSPSTSIFVVWVAVDSTYLVPAPVVTRLVDCPE